MNWEWEIVAVMKYIMIETRRESITYRTNLARLMDKLIEEGKVNKSKVIALAMTKMPLDKFINTLGGAICKGY
jgi:Na+-transporting NADH:ubiquinone oxidoreductase subunit NqrA